MLVARVISLQFYRIQVLVAGGSYYCWTHWGRVGQLASNSPSGFCSRCLCLSIAHPGCIGRLFFFLVLCLSIAHLDCCSSTLTLGEDGQNAMKNCGGSSAAAVSEFEKKFKGHDS